MGIRKKLSYLMVFLLVFSAMFSCKFNSVKADTTGAVYFNVQTGITVGSDFTFYVNCENLNDLYGVSMDWKFDPSVLQVTDVEPGNLYKSFLPGTPVSTPVKNIDNTKGELNYVIMLLGDVPGVANASSNLLIIHAKALKPANIVLKAISDNSDLSLSGNNVRFKFSNSNASPIPATLNSGNILINTVPAKLNSFTSDLASPQVAGSTINFTASATSNSGPLYQFWIKDASGWSIAQDYSSKNTLSWRPLKGGSYVISVYVKDTYSSRTVDALQTINYTINSAAPVTISSINVDKQSPQPLGSAVNFTASASGGIDLLYQFWIKDSSGWSLAQDYSSKNTLSWKPSKAGDYVVSVYVKDKYSNNSVDAFKTIDYKITAALPVVINSLTSDKQSPQTVGNIINFTASASGGLDLLYQFWIKDSNGWSLAQDYSSKNTLAWKPLKADNYIVSVYVKDKYSSKSVDALKTVDYSITAAAPVSITSLISDKPSPQAAGSIINFTASASGGSELLYQFWIKDAAGWSLAQDYSTKNTLAWKPLKTGDYIVSVYVKDRYSSKTVDALMTVNYKVLSAAPVSLNSITLDKNSPQPAGSSVKVTANATGGTQLIYQFWINDGSGWTLAQDYSANNVLDWKPSKSGSYIISVYVKDKSSNQYVDSFKTINYTIN